MFDEISAPHNLFTPRIFSVYFLPTWYIAVSKSGPNLTKFTKTVPDFFIKMKYVSTISFPTPNDLLQNR